MVQKQKVLCHLEIAFLRFLLIITCWISWKFVNPHVRENVKCCYKFKFIVIHQLMLLYSVVIQKLIRYIYMLHFSKINTSMKLVFVNLIHPSCWKEVSCSNSILISDFNISINYHHQNIVFTCSSYVKAKPLSVVHFECSIGKAVYLWYFLFICSMKCKKGKTLIINGTLCFSKSYFSISKFRKELLIMSLAYISAFANSIIH